MKMKYQYLSFMLCLCFSFLSMNITAQSSNSNCSKSKTTCSSSNYSLNVSMRESDDQSIYTLGYSSKYTDKVEAFLIKKLGRNYSKSRTGSKNWNNNYAVVSKNGHTCITYNGSNEGTKDDAKKLFNDIIDVVKSEKG